MAALPGERPLCVDLDGTLLRTDTLHESLVLLIARNPMHLLRLPLWLLGGKAAFKREVAVRVVPDPSTLPHDPRVLELLHASDHRTRVLCTAADRAIAEAVAGHLGVFDEILASDGERNLSGPRKADALAERFGERGFDYAGNAHEDIAVWRRCARAWVVNAPSAVERGAREVAEIAGVLPRARHPWRALAAAMRPHQWLKNLLVFVPLLASHRLTDPGALGAALLAFAAFCACASAIYIVNDLLDLQADRTHPRKRGRPFASGDAGIPAGAALSTLLGATGLGLAWLVSPAFFALLAGYVLATSAYSLRLKRVIMTDVVVLAGLYTLRILGGAIAIDGRLSFWLLAFSMFLFFSLAMLKRATELGAMKTSGAERSAGRGYRVHDLPMIQALGAASGYIAVLVFALYINSPESLALYGHPQWLWLICPLLLYWVGRAWLLAHRGDMHDDPVVFAATDRTSQCIAAACGLLVFAAT
jgi:4-hydroxybenzoate polyprenyltransferase